jgi:hypothetical protein
MKYTFEQLCEAILNDVREHGYRISEDDLYQKVINIRSLRDTTLSLWLGPNKELYLVTWHDPFMLDIMQAKYRKDPNRSSLMKELDKDTYKFAFERGWLRITITNAQFGVNGCQDTVDSARGYISSLAKQFDLTLYIDSVW